MPVKDSWEFHPYACSFDRFYNKLIQCSTVGLNGLNPGVCETLWKNCRKKIHFNLFSNQIQIYPHTRSLGNTWNTWKWKEVTCFLILGFNKNPVTISFFSKVCRRNVHLQNEKFCLWLMSWIFHWINGLCELGLFQLGQEKGRGRPRYCLPIFKGKL